MKIFLNLCAIVVPVLLLLSIFRRINGAEQQLTLTYMLNIFSNFEFDLARTKEVISFMKYTFNYSLDPANITDLNSFFIWFGDVLSFIIINPINFCLQLLRDIGDLFYNLFTIIVELFGLSLA